MRTRRTILRLVLLVGVVISAYLEFGIVPASAGSGADKANPTGKAASVARRPMQQITADQLRRAHDAHLWAGQYAGMQQITVDQLRRAVVAHLEARLGGRVGEVEAEILDPSEPVLRPVGSLQLEITSGGRTDTAGRRRFRIVPMVAGQETESLDVIADVSLYADVVAPTRMLKPEELIEPDDVGVVRVKVNGVPHHFLVNPDEAVGKSPGKVLQPQMPIRGSALVKPFTVRKGDRVTIEARRGGLSIQATGITKAAAQLGQFVTVTNQDSGKEVRGRVAGPGLVRVEF